MTIQSIDIKNYQSHTDSHIDLGPGLTVLVGASSAGKSAVTRAIKAATSNPVGKDFITHGESTMQVSITSDRGTVVLTKGKPEDSYVILPADDPKNPKKYTKLGRDVPPDVTAFLGIDAKDAINFAGQFDMPYLLTTSGAEVARTLGDLTNVAAIFEASREALRRKGTHASTLRTRQADLAALEPKIEAYADLEARLTAQEAAETAFKAAETAQNRLQRLNDLLLTLQTATARVKAAEGRTAAPLPDTDAARAILARLDRLNALLITLGTQKKTYESANARIVDATDTITELDDQYDALLREAGECPTCHQSTKEIHHAHA